MQKITTAQRRAILAIKMRGGEVSEFRQGERRNWATMDRFGGLVEQFDRRIIEGLAARGHLRLARFERGGAVYQVTAEPEARAAFMRD
ncbi:MAG: hypothetical protein MRY74_04475 [Neomegalonema sp.]|nr:hypothetical protein [Neomegalonema sp.]